MLTHPSGWGFKEQMVLRKALANAIPETALVDPTATDRIVFVSEAIATAYFCLQYYSPWSTTDNAFTVRWHSAAFNLRVYSKVTPRFSQDLALP